MEQENNVQAQEIAEPSAQVQPVQAVVQSAAPVQPEAVPQGKKGTSVWVWLLGGCFMVCLLALLAVVALGWWGVRKVKHEIRKYEPGVERVQENLDKMGKEAEEWQKKSEEFRDSIPSPDDIETDMQ